MKTITADELRKYRDREHEKSYLLIDVRQPVEYEEYHIPGSLLLPLSEFEEKVEELPQKNLIFYCKSGMRSKSAALTADFFNESGKEIYTLDGGILSWNGIAIQGLPNFDLFDMTKPLKEILIDAMNLEKGAFRFYDYILNYHKEAPASTAASMGNITESIKDVRDGELGHAKLIHSSLKKLDGSTAPFDEIYQTLSGEILEGGVHLSDLITTLEKRALEFSGIETSKRQKSYTHIADIIESAISMEYSAFDLYRVLSEKDLTQDHPEIREVFYSLAQIEKRHMNILVKLLEDLLSAG